MSSEQLRVAMLSVHSCPLGRLGTRDTGGMSVYIREISRELGRRGIRVDIYTRAHDPEEERIVDLGENARVVHLQVGQVEPVNKLALYADLADFACAVEGFRRRNSLRYDLVHSHYWLSGWVGERLRVWWSVPHITMFHTLGAVKNAIGVGEDEPELRLVNEAELARGCDRIMAATEKEKGDLVALYGASGDRVGVVPCGVNLGLFQRVDRESARQRLGFNSESIVLYVGRVEPLKGLDRLLMAMPRLEVPRHLRTVVVGGDDEADGEVERLRSLSSSLGIGAAVDFVGVVRQEELPLYYSAADLCIVPSHYETFGLVALESLACGTPVVATRVGGMESVIRHGRNGYLVHDNSPESLAAGMAAVLEQPCAIAETPVGIRASVAPFVWSNVADGILREYFIALPFQGTWGRGDRCPLSRGD